MGVVSRVQQTQILLFGNFQNFFPQTFSIWWLAELMGTEPTDMEGRLCTHPIHVIVPVVLGGS